MALELVTDVGSTQHGTVIYKVLVTPFLGATRLLPAPPNIQKGDQIAFSNSKPAQHAQRHDTVLCGSMCFRSGMYEHSTQQAQHHHACSLLETVPLPNRF